MEMEDPQYKSDDGSALRVYRDTAKNPFLSEREGRPIYDDVIYCEIISPGSRDSTPIFEMVRFLNPEMEADKPLYGMKYPELKKYIDLFIKEDETDESLSGTPLKQWPEISRSMVASLRAQNIYTVDALANLPDTKISVVGPDGRTWRTKAQAYIENAKNTAYATKLAADLERMQDDLKARDEQIAEMAKRIEELSETHTLAKSHELPKDTTSKGGKKDDII